LQICAAALAIDETTSIVARDFDLFQKNISEIFSARDMVRRR
jgi:hypothetical protein